MPASGFHLDIVLSTDTSVPLRYATYSPNFAEDVLLGGGREHIDSLGAGKTLSVPLTGPDKLPGNTPPGKYFIGIVIDPADTIKEFAKGNNIAFAPIEILPCGTPADISGCQILGASGGTTGFASMDLGWSYGNGERPSQLLITVYRKVQGSWDNIMPSQQAFNVPSPATVTRDTVVIFRLFAGDYKIFMQTTYSCDQHKEFSFEQSLGREALRAKPSR